jgi:putative endopeptidase
LQYPLFDPKLSDAEILGAIGMVVGHELGHGFDNNGSKYDENGVKRQWMPDSDLKEFQRRTNLLVSQFNRLQFDPFNFPDLFETKPKTPVLKAVSSVNPDYGNLTLGENIADTSGLRFAYEAAFPGNVGSLDEKRAFYLQYARVWCGTMRSGEFTKRLLSDYHAQTFFRVNEPLKHQPRFHEAYACKPGNKMYLAPEKQMDLW